MSRIRIERLDQTPPCARCGRPSVIATDVPVSEFAAVPIELCRSCDADKDAGSWLLAVWDMRGDERSAKDVADAMAAWMKEAMAAQSWHYAPCEHPPAD